MFYKQTKNSDFSDKIYITIKNEFKMMWLNRNTKVFDSYLPQKWEVIACSMCLGSPTRSHIIAHCHNIARVDCCTCTYFFPKQTVFGSNPMGD